MNSSRLKIIIFAKAPRAGFAKTRLMPALGAEGAARLAQKMLEYTLQQCVAAQLGVVELCVAPDCDDRFWQDFESPPGVLLSSQGAGDLGERLSRASKRALAENKPVLLIGTDCPQLTAARLRAAAQALGEQDAVLHPTRDGGYALLGLNFFDPGIFQEVAWSTAQVAQQTKARLQECKMSFRCLEMLRDIDEPEDLEFLPEEWHASL
jgi:hypothetical protein